jgi:hypothetical protein
MPPEEGLTLTCLGIRHAAMPDCCQEDHMDWHSDVLAMIRQELAAHPDPSHERCRDLRHAVGDAAYELTKRLYEYWEGKKVRDLFAPCSAAVSDTIVDLLAAAGLGLEQRHSSRESVDSARQGEYDQELAKARSLAAAVIRRHIGS